jgi:hypothetical protein
LLDGKRGLPATVYRHRSPNALARFSVLAADLAGRFQEIDVNPVLCGPSACVSLDALVVEAATGGVPATAVVA